MRDRKIKRKKGKSEVYFEIVGHSAPPRANGTLNIKGNSLDALYLLQTLLNNYNKNLASLKEDSTLIALRFLQYNNFNGDSSAKVPYIGCQSAHYISKNYEDFPVVGYAVEDKELGTVAVDEDEMRALFGDGSQKGFYIQMDWKRFFFRNMFRTLTPFQYKLKIRKPFFNISKIPIVNLDLRYAPIYFNEIEEVMEIVKLGVWRHIDDPKKIICCEDLSYHYVEKFSKRFLKKYHLA